MIDKKNDEEYKEKKCEDEEPVELTTLFHNASEYLYCWITKQQNVKEESLTDWLLYYLSEQCPNIYYQTFSRHKEAETGADWEWWILTPKNSNRDKYLINHNGDKYNAYRFLVQAKKLHLGSSDNYLNLSYSNKNGFQIDLLLEEAQARSAFPLYAFYSTTEPIIEEQVKNIIYVNKETLQWCNKCTNGGYLSPAYTISHILHELPRHKINDIEVLNHSCKLSVCDLLFKYSNDRCEELLTLFNYRYIKPLGITKNSSGVDGIKHSGKGIPEYLSIFVERQKENLDWFQKEMHRDLGGIGGLGVIDLRNKNGFK